MSKIFKNDNIERRTIAVIIDNESGALARVTALFAGRGYNIEALTVSEITNNKSRITLTTSGSPRVLSQIKKLLERLVPVHKVVDLTIETESIERELSLIKLVTNNLNNRLEIIKISEIFSAKIILITSTHIIFEIAHSPDEIDRFIENIQNFGELEITRTGVTAISTNVDILE